MKPTLVRKNMMLKRKNTEMKEMIVGFTNRTVASVECICGKIKWLYPLGEQIQHRDIYQVLF